MSVDPISVNLTKKILLAAPEGAFIVSNCGESPTKPLLAEAVSNSAERDVQWKRILKAEANHRLCRVFVDQEEYHEWLRNALQGK